MSSMTLKFDITHYFLLFVRDKRICHNKIFGIDVNKKLLFRHAIWSASSVVDR